MRLLWLPPLLMLSACGPNRDANIYGGFQGPRVVGNEAYATVSYVWNEVDAQQLADRHCANYGKISQYIPSITTIPTFSCIVKRAP